MFVLPHPLRLLVLTCLLPPLHAQDLPGGSVTDYAPQTNVQCPDFSTTSFIRQWSPQNQTLHPREEEYLNTRAQNVLPGAWKDWLGDGSRIGYDLNALNFTGAWPKIGIALPGGGLRAAQFAAGALSGLDARNETAKAAGTGGLLQVASYISGLSGESLSSCEAVTETTSNSGGSWITGSLYFNNFPTLHDLVLGNGKDLSGWKLDLPFATPDGTNLFSDKNQAFYGSILWSVRAKAEKGM